MATATIKISGMTCSGCVNSVTNALKGVEGVKEANVELEKGQATVIYDESKTTEVALKETVEDAGYDIKK